MGKWLENGLNGVKSDILGGLLILGGFASTIAFPAEAGSAFESLFAWL